MKQQSRTSRAVSSCSATGVARRMRQHSSCHSHASLTLSTRGLGPDRLARTALVSDRGAALFRRHCRAGGGELVCAGHAPDGARAEPSHGQRAAGSGISGGGRHPAGNARGALQVHPGPRATIRASERVSVQNDSAEARRRVARRNGLRGAIRKRQARLIA